jgi:CDP-diacylglycerol---glycerol-3-phosphate 3-phosphatidyltransferase
MSKKTKPEIQPKEKSRIKSLDDWFRATFRGVLTTLAVFFNRIGFHPNTMTILGLAGTVTGAALLGLGHMTIGGFVILVSGVFDALDGTMARLRDESTRFGAFVDSVCDRFADLSIFGGLLAWFIQQQDWLTCGIIYVAAVGTVMVSYIKARAESLGYSAKVGLLSRVGRYLVIVPGLVFNIPVISIWIIAIFANYTALQRIWYVRKQALGLTPSEPPSLENLK